MRQKDTLAPEAGPALGVITAFSVVINLLGLSGALYMFQVYDRVLHSYSTPTLVVLTILVMVLFIVQGIVIALRGLMTARLATRIQARNIDWTLSESGRRARAKKEQAKAGPPEKTPAEDLEAVVQGLRGGGLVAVLDAPWAVAYLVILTILAPWIGLFATAAVVLFVAVTLISARLRSPAAEPAEEEMPARAAWQAALRAGVDSPAASLDRAAAKLAEGRGPARDSKRLESERSSVQRGFSSTMRNIAQAGVLAVGAWLVITDQATLGAIMASVMLIGRIFSPVETAMRERRSIRAGLAGWRRLKLALRRNRREGRSAPVTGDGAALRGPVKARGLAAAPVPQAPPAIAQVGFELEPGQLMLVVGHSGAGKSLLLRTLAGFHPAAQGAVSIGGTRLGRMDTDLRDRLIGYLPQEPVFMPGTVAEAIARHDPEVSRETVIEAAKRVGAHERLNALPRGYDTPLPPQGAPLPYGLLRLIGLARAFCRSPHLLVLDDPLAGVHPTAQRAVTEAIQAHKGAGGVVIVAGQPPAYRDLADRVLMLAEGKVQNQGTPDEVLKPRRVGAPGTPPGRAAGLGGRGPGSGPGGNSGPGITSVGGDYA